MEELIEKKNILRTATFLLSLDIHALAGKHRFKSYHLLVDLQEASDNFQYRSQKNHFILYSEKSRKILIKNSFFQLQNCVRKLLLILKKSVMESLHLYIHDSTMELPVYEIWE